MVRVGCVPEAGWVVVDDGNCHGGVGLGQNSYGNSHGLLYRIEGTDGN